MNHKIAFIWIGTIWLYERPATHTKTPQCVYLQTIKGQLINRCVSTMKSDSTEMHMISNGIHTHTHTSNTIWKFEVFYDLKRCTRFYSIQVVWCSMIPDFMFEYKWVYCYKSMSMECPFSLPFAKKLIVGVCVVLCVYTLGVCVNASSIEITLHIWLECIWQCGRLCIRKYFRVTKLLQKLHMPSYEMIQILKGISVYSTPLFIHSIYLIQDWNLFNRSSWVLPQATQTINGHTIIIAEIVSSVKRLDYILNLIQLN